MKESRDRRRRLVAGLAGLVALAAVAAGLFALTRSTGPPPPQVDIGEAAEFPPGSMTEMELNVLLPGPVSGLTAEGGESRIRIIVVNDPAAGMLALFTKDPHLGCRVGPASLLSDDARLHLEPEVAIWNPCHGESYDRAGRWLAGPSPRGLDRFGVSVVDGRVIVDVMAYEEGPPR